MHNNRSFSYCLNTSTIRDCGLSVEEEIRVAAQAGYQGIELWVSEIDRYLAQGGQLPKLKEMLDQHDLTVPNIIAFFQWANPDNEARRKELEEAKRILTIARNINCAYVAAPPAGIANMAGIPLEDIAEYFSDLLKISRDIGVEPLLEFWGHARVLGSLKEATQVLEFVGDPDAKLLGDVFHMAKTEGSFELLRSLKGNQLGLFHVNDYPDAPVITKLKDDQRVYPGDGTAPLAQITRTLRDIEYTGMLSLELFNKEYQEKGADNVAETGIRKMREIFSKE